MPRYCFELHVRPERLDEYVERHRAVWPEMLEALEHAGWNNYSLFLRADGLLIGYVEADDLDAARRAMADTGVNDRWQAEMAPFFADLDGAPDDGFALLREVFHLEDQLARHRDAAADPTTGHPRHPGHPGHPGHPSAPAAAGGNES